MKISHVPGSLIMILLNKAAGNIKKYMGRDSAERTKLVMRLVAWKRRFRGHMSYEVHTIGLWLVGHQPLSSQIRGGGGIGVNISGGLPPVEL